MENGISSSHIDGGIHLLNSWQSLPWMWEERVPNNNKKKKKKKHMP